MSTPLSIEYADTVSALERKIARLEAELAEAYERVRRRHPPGRRRMNLTTASGREAIRDAPVDSVPKWGLLAEALDLLDQGDEKIASLESELAAAKECEAEARATLKAVDAHPDDPTLDATDAAHPAWWRGHEHTTAVFCRMVHDILDGKDDGAGANVEPWASVRRRLLELASTSPSGDAVERAGDAQFDAMLAHAPHCQMWQEDAGYCTCGQEPIAYVTWDGPGGALHWASQLSSEQASGMIPLYTRSALEAAGPRRPDPLDEAASRLASGIATRFPKTGARRVLELTVEAAVQRVRAELFSDEQIMEDEGRDAP